MTYPTVTPDGTRRFNDDEATAQLYALAREMRTNSERWFPATHDPSKQDMPLDVFYTLGLTGEVGELANDIKKLHRDGGAAAARNARTEMADVFAYLLLLADHLGVDLVAEYRRKVEVNEQRWGDQPEDTGSDR